jgi:hypothetical protein
MASNEKMEESDDPIGRWRPLMVVQRIARKSSDSDRSVTCQGINHENPAEGFIVGAARLLVRDGDHPGLNEGRRAAGAADLTSRVRISAGGLALVFAGAATTLPGFPIGSRATAAFAVAAALGPPRTIAGRLEARPMAEKLEISVGAPADEVRRPGYQRHRRRQPGEQSQG